MKLLTKLAVLLMCLTLSGFAQIGNIQITDLDGNSYDLYEMLNKGRYVYVQMIFDTWPSCPGAVPGQNTLWEKYGCYKCDDYPLFVITADFSTGDSKQDVISWCNSYNVEYPACYHAEGGADFNIELDNDNYGGPKYWISPDKSFKDYSSSDVSNAGLQEHVCAVPITNNLNKEIINTNISLYNLNKNGFSLKVLEADNYTISFYSVNGKLKSTFSKILAIGSHQISFEKGTFASGVYLVELSNGQTVTRQKTVLE